MRKRHFRLSMRQMALDAGLGESTVSSIIQREAGARPETLKALADRWGTEEDYRELMRLAGHPVTEREITREHIEGWMRDPESAPEGVTATTIGDVRVIVLGDEKPDIEEMMIGTRDRRVRYETLSDADQDLIENLNRVIGQLDQAKRKLIFHLALAMLGEPEPDD